MEIHLSICKVNIKVSVISFIWLFVGNSVFLLTLIISIMSNP